MRDGHKITIVMVGILSVIAALVYALAPYASSGLSSSIAQSLGIFILSLGIVSSTIAVLSGRGIEEYFRRKREVKRIKSALVSYLSKIHVQIVKIGSVFYNISEIATTLPPDPRDPAYFADYKNLDLDSFMQTSAKELLDAGPIDSSYYRQNVEDHLLYLSPDLADHASFLDVMVYILNDYYEGLSNTVNKRIPFPKSTVTLPLGYIIFVDLYTQRKAYRLMHELALEFRDYVFSIKKAILRSQTVLPRYLALLEKVDLITKTMNEDSKEFLKMVFPSQSSSRS